MNFWGRHNICQTLLITDRSKEDPVSIELAIAIASNGVQSSRLSRNSQKSHYVTCLLAASYTGAFSMVWWDDNKWFLTQRDTEEFQISQ
ncbi:hypothetical protein AVEN_97427-1 [Araneus ventricosus]|uniref:Uncharacterized protein n=1 Tax=Araneus ventricosus TaxID=182803 RepID=A0A4Y2ELV1_ARAVE|nr:hypothetical protein AVEN_97427-1 [Araneus ventricosus]